MRMYSPLAFVGSGGLFDSTHIDDKGRDIDGPLIARFYKAFPGLRFLPQAKFFTFEFGNPAPVAANPITTYI